MIKVAGMSKLTSMYRPIVKPVRTTSNKKNANYRPIVKRKNVKKTVPSPKSFEDSSAKNKKIADLIRFYQNQTHGNKSSYELQYFDRLYSIIPNQELSGLCQYVFFVRPDLNIYASDDKDGKTLLKQSSKQIKSGYHSVSYPAEDQFIRYMQQCYPNTLRSLTSQLPGAHDFIPFLVGRTESLQIPDYSIQDYSLTQPYTGYTIPYASHAKKSTTGGSFDVTFREDKALRIHKLFQTWLYYIDAVTTNKFEPKLKHIRHNKMDYATSVYCITCAPDAETILFWTKYVGAFPTVNPNSNLSFNLRGSVDNKITITFNYFKAEVLDPYILVDFNKNSHVTNADSRPYVPIYSGTTLGDIKMKDPRSSEQKKIDRRLTSAKVHYSETLPVVVGTGNGLVGAPYICKVGKTFHLRWKKISKNIAGK